MTDILCRWLNNELSLTKPVDQQSFAREFASGYLIGEVLNKYQLQDDFDQFSQNTQSDAKLNNFTRLEPSLHLLAIPFDTNLARDIMTERHGVATRLMYQLYIALNNKKKANLTGVAMETMRPAAPAKLNAYESLMYKERLKQKTPRQTDLNLDALVARFHDKQIAMEKIAFEKRFVEQERIQIEQQNQRLALLERSRIMKAKQSEMVAKIQAATVHIPRPPPNKTLKAIQIRKDNKTKREALETMKSIADFEDQMKLILPPSKLDDNSSVSESIDLQYFTTNEDDKDITEAIDLIMPAPNDDYINKIRTRLQEDASAREEREKRRRKVLVDQMTAHENQEEARREEILVNRLMRQSQQERRIAVQLMQTRHEKEVVRRNRILREKQYEERRRKDFEDALNKEAEMARLSREEYEEQIKKDKELHDKIAAERTEAKYKKHYDMCSEVVDQIVDFTCKVAEYRELTNNLLPPKLMREWTALFVAGKPLFDKPVESSDPTPEQILEEERQQLLDEGDFMEYKNMIGEWQTKEGLDVTGPPRDNPIVGHIVQRLFNIVHPPSPPPSPPEFQPFPIKACVLGKVFSGKTTCVQKLAEEHRLQVLCVDVLVDQAVEAHKAGEIIEITDEEDNESKAETVQDFNPTPVDVAPTPVEMEPVSAPTEQISATEQVPDSTEQTPADTEQTPATDPAPTPDSGREVKPPSVSVSQNNSRTSLAKKSSSRMSNKPQATARAKLGSKVFKFLKKGKPVDEQLIVDILVEAIRRVPEGTGWLIDGFPQNYNQAKLLEKALSGFDANAKESTKDKTKGKMKRSSLVPDPRPPPPPAEPISGIDVVIVLDIDDKVCIKRAAGRTCAIQANEQFHEEFKPPPDGSATGVGKQEKVVPVQDMAHDMEQIQHRITGFVDSWPKLEKWFTRFGTLKIVDAEADERTVVLEVEKILEDTLNRLQGKDKESTPAEEIPEEKPEEKPEPPAPVEPVPEPPKEPETPAPKSRPGSRGSGGKKSPSRTSSKESPSKKDKREKSDSPKRSSSKKSDTGGSKKGSRGSSPKSPSAKRSKSGKGKNKTPEPEPEPEPEIPTGPPPPQPGSEEWDFVDQNIETDLAEVLATHWEAVESAYVANSKHVFRNIRDERENICRYFYQMKKDYMAYLRRPDHKQEFVSQWQKDYNEVPDDIREDEETKAELHQRVDDLRERLWSICDERKEQAERERETIMNDGWLDDRMGVLSNHYFTLMQTEVDRFQDTVRLLKDYYRGMDGQIPDELNQNYARLPLIELPVERPESPDKVSETASTPPITDDPITSAKSERTKSARAKSPRESRSKSPKDGSKSPKESRSKSRTPSAKRRNKSKENDKDKTADPNAMFDADTNRKRIPLIPRRPLSPDVDAKPGAGGKDKKDKKAVKKDDVPGGESPAPPIDLDEKLIIDAASSAVSSMGQIMSAELAAREAEEEAERQAEIEREKERERIKAAAKKPAKKGKSRSPSPSKKNAKKDSETATTTTPPPSEEMSEEETKKKEIKEKMREEYYFAIAEEENAAKTRVELIKVTAMLVLQDLKLKGEECYKDMNDWLGARFLKEMESIDQLSEAMRFGIEAKEKIKQELLLNQEDFMVNQDLQVLKSSSSILEVQQKEPPTLDLFTVDQLKSLYQQFILTAPNGVLSSRTFVETFETIVSVTYGLEALPDHWMNINHGQIQEIANSLSTDSDYVDWRRFLLSLTQPIPTPTQTDLLQTLSRFKDMDQKSTGCVTREQYDNMNLWFATESKADGKFDRLDNLKKVLFDIYGNLTTNPARLDYVSMLMYFSAVPNSHEGFLRALSVASGHHMPRLAKPSLSTLQLDQPAIIDDGTLPEGLEVEKDDRQVEPPMTGEIIPDEAIEAKVPIDSLFKVFHHGESTHGDSHRYNLATDPEETTSREKLAAVYVELGSEDLEPVLYRILIEHPLIQDAVAACKSFKALDIRGILSNPVTDYIDATSTKTME
ncbi:hypothetical protein SNE40_011674 [Patella caerulea]|uniref:Calponin-homology (CH) domain-containing protein n=1 Tax=Patella caerulea TaxID=87958 RepID=A0AAN8JNV6_PATCE